MHEHGLCEGVLEAVDRRARGRRVAAVGVRVGAFLRVVPDAFTQSFQLAASGGVAADASVDVVIVPGEVACRTCGEVGKADDPVPACMVCGSVDVDVRGGDELTLEWLRYVEVG